MVKFKSNLKSVEQALTQAEERVLESVGLFCRGEMQTRSPVISGAYRDSHDYRIDNKTVIIGNSIEYSVYVELGNSRGMKAQHVIENSVMQNTSKIKRLVESQYKL